MINDSESHAIIHEIDIVYMWVGVSGTLTKCDACQFYIMASISQEGG